MLRWHTSAHAHPRNSPYTTSRPPVVSPGSNYPVQMLQTAMMTARTSVRGIFAATAVPALLAAAVACGPAEPEYVPYFREPVSFVRFAQAGAFADSAGAAALRDSLDAAGWYAFVRRDAGRDTLPPWRVAVDPSEGRITSLLTGASLLRAGLPVTYATDSVPPRGVMREALVANAGDRGQIVQTRWALSPDGEVLVAIEDPSAVENEPLPDGMVAASERGSWLVRIDSVWDVAIDRDWQTLVYGKAYLATARRAEGITAREWFRIAYYTGMDASIVRRHAFDASTMNEAVGFGQPVVVRLDSVTPRVGGTFGGASRPLPFPSAWRLRFTGDGSRFAVGTSPSRISDDADPRLWMSVSLASGLGRADLPAEVANAGARWTAGPMIDVSVSIDSGHRSFPIPGGTVESHDGWITVRGERTAGVRRTVASGTVLAVTRTGRYVLALVADPQPRRDMVPYRLAVLELR